MIDPIPPPSTWLVEATRPLARLLSFQTLPYHIHEIILALCLYQAVQSVVSPRLSTYLFPRIYPNLNRRTKLNWDVHVVSMVQSCLINTIALWVIFRDEERSAMTALERVYGYTGAAGTVQGLAAGYFLWDLIVCSRHYGVFGFGLWAHALCALVVFSFGFRPFCNYYGATFILYELSSPFLNVHWFCDKLNLTGSKIQWWNGMVLLASFFSCRLVWGTYQSLQVYQDVWAAMHMNTTVPGALGTFGGANISNSASPIFVPRNGELCMGQSSCVAAQAEVMKFVGPGIQSVPFWLAMTYLVSNLILNALNFYWFAKMVETVRKRFAEKPLKKDGMERTPIKVEGQSTAVNGSVDVKRR